MKVELINYTQNPELQVALAARLCYSKVGIDELKEQLDEIYIEKMIKQLFESGHTSTFEHVSFTFAIEGVSRVLTHQLVRHRLASYSQQSQRYVNAENFDFVIPNSFKNKVIVDEDSGTMIDGELWFKRKMQQITKMYENAIKSGISKEDARYLLPNATDTKIIVTMNARALLNFFEERCCMRAQLEIRELANKMLSLVREVAPNIFEKAGASCSWDKCREGKMSCKKGE